MRKIILVPLCLLFLSAHAYGADLTTLFPNAVKDLKRVQLVTGKQAQDEVDKLHGKSLVAEESIIGRYARPGERPAEVWLSRVSSKAEARRQTALMVHLMYENPKSPFKNPSRLDHNETAVYRFTGMGQAHLIYYQGDLVYWISASPADQATMLEAFCN